MVSLTATRVSHGQPPTGWRAPFHASAKRKKGKMETGNTAVFRAVLGGQRLGGERFPSRPDLRSIAGIYIIMISTKAPP